MLVALLAITALPSSDAVLQTSSETEFGRPLGPLKIRHGVAGDRFLTPKEQHEARLRGEDVMGGLPFMTLTEVLNKVRSSLPDGFGPKSTIINVGASYKDVDPIYSLDLSTTHPQGYNLIGYECSHIRLPRLRKMRPDVMIRAMCVTGPKIVRDMKELNVEDRFSLVKTDIDSVDGPVLDAILRDYKPYVVYSEIMWDFAPPVEFTLVKVEGSAYNPFAGGCFGMSISMVDHILRRNGYRLIEAAHANIIAVHEDVAHLFENQPQDPWFWYQATKSGLYSTHWLGGRRNAQKNSPLSLYGEGLGLYTEMLNTDGKDNFEKPPVGIRSMDIIMARIAERVIKGCTISGESPPWNMQHKYMLAVGDRCCAPQWGKLDNCVCEFPEDAKDDRTQPV